MGMTWDFMGFKGIQWDVCNSDFMRFFRSFFVLYNAIHLLGGAVEITVMAITIVIFTPMFLGIWGPMVKSIAL